VTLLPFRRDPDSAVRVLLLHLRAAAAREHLHVRHPGRVAVMDQPDLTAAVRADEVVAVLHLDAALALGRGVCHIHAPTLGPPDSRVAQSTPNAG